MHDTLDYLSKEPVPKPTLIFDGDCGFCRRWAGRWRALTSEKIDYVTSQSCEGRFPQIPPRGFEESVWLVEPDGRTTGAAEAVFRSLWLAGQKRWMYWAYVYVPLFAPISEGFYWLISHNRSLADKLDVRLIAEPCDQKRSFVISGALLLRAIGVVYLVALISLRGQIDGLIGSQGILPAQTYFDDFRSVFPTAASRLFTLPSIFWFSCSDAAMHAACNVGIVCAVLLILGVLPALNSLILWIIYLSFVIAGQMFLGYQWDALLLEAGFLAIFLSPLGLTPGRRQPSRIVMFLFRWLLFRLMLLSGLVKLASGDVTWRRLSAMRFHYQTQPLPTWTSWYMQQQPVWFATFSTGLVLIIEIAAPMFIFATRRRRIASLILLVTLQLLIAATGNYGFFNLLALVLCLTLVDDAAWRKLRLFRKDRNPRERRRWPWWIVTPLAIVLVLLSLVTGARQIGGNAYIRGFASSLAFRAEAFEIANGYGLFANMTTERPELIIEGSNDGSNWLPYEFKYKPGDVTRRPKFCSPGMPRLDWQMWFAALDPPSHASMLVGLLDGLKRGSKPVLSLLANNPFPDHPPRYLRITEYTYQFTTPSERSQTGAWWKREPIGELKFE